MKSIIKLLAVALISSVIGLHSAFGQTENKTLSPNFEINADYVCLESLSPDLTSEDVNFSMAIAEVVTTPLYKHSETPTSEAVSTPELNTRSMRFLELEIDNRIDKMISIFGVEKVKGLQLEMMIDIRGKIAKLEMVDTYMDPLVVKELLYHIEKWEFKYRKGENTRFVLSID